MIIENKMVRFPDATLKSKISRFKVIIFTAYKTGVAQLCGSSSYRFIPSGFEKAVSRAALPRFGYDEAVPFTALYIMSSVLPHTSFSNFFCVFSDRKYKQFCDDTTVEKQRAIKEGNEMIEILQADIQKYEADAAQLAKEIAKHDEDISTWEGLTNVTCKKRKKR